MSKYILKAKSSSGYIFKVLAEILQTNLKTSCFQIKKTGIFLRQMDDNRSTLIDLQLLAENFDLFEFNSLSTHGQSSFFIGLTLTHLYKLLKTVKKKDAIKLTILRDVPTEISISVKSKDRNRTTTSFLKIQRVQNILVDIPTGYNVPPIFIPSCEFQKIYKDILSIGKTVTISTRNNALRFDVDAGGIVKRRVEYKNSEEDEDSESDEEDSRYSEVFDTEQLVKLSKMSNLSDSLQISSEQNLPLVVSAKTGLLGNISIYVKNKSQIAYTQA
jgi:proliferating cell nuclear antigen PCNA